MPLCFAYDRRRGIASRALALVVQSAGGERRVADDERELGGNSVDLQSANESLAPKQRENGRARARQKIDSLQRRAAVAAHATAKRASTRKRASERANDSDDHCIFETTNKKLDCILSLRVFRRQKSKLTERRTMMKRRQSCASEFLPFRSRAAAAAEALPPRDFRCD